jgi:hypothetical protein
MKEAWQRQRNSSNAFTGFFVGEGVPRRVTPARKLEPPAIYRLAWRGNPTGWENSSFRGDKW